MIVKGLDQHRGQVTAEWIETDTGEGRVRAWRRRIASRCGGSRTVFDTSAQADESTRVASTWVREQKLETALPNPPKITSGEVVVHRTRELVPGAERAIVRCRRAFPSGSGYARPGSVA
jgi:hypothetical protein